jgi:hypothetical protein
VPETKITSACIQFKLENVPPIKQEKGPTNHPYSCTCPDPKVWTKPDCGAHIFHSLKMAIPNNDNTTQNFFRALGKFKSNANEVGCVFLKKKEKFCIF